MIMMRFRHQINYGKMRKIVIIILLDQVSSSITIQIKAINQVNNYHLEKKNLSLIRANHKLDKNGSNAVLSHLKLDFNILIILIHLMSDQKLSNHEDNKGARRSRKDEEGRDFICGCGKKYLSYPALYTHIKTKHEGHQPEGTQKTGVPSVNKRNKQKLEEKIGREIQSMVEVEDLKIITILNSTVKGTVAFNYRIKKQYVGAFLWEAFLGLTKKNELSLEKKIDLPTILVVYLIGAGQYVSESMLSYYSIFAQKFASCYIEHGQEVHEVCFKGECQSRIRSISIDDCRFSPIISEFFIKCYLPEFGVGQEELEIFQFLCYDFCTWLNNKRLSLVKVTLNKEYKFVHKHTIEKSRIRKEKKMNEKNLDEIAEEFRGNPQSRSSELMESQGHQMRDLEDFEHSHSEEEGDHLDYVLFGQH